MARDSRQMAGKSSMAPGGEVRRRAARPSPASPRLASPHLSPCGRPGPRRGPGPWLPPQRLPLSRPLTERHRGASPSGPSRLQDGGRPPPGGGKARLPYQRWRRSPLPSPPPAPPTRPARLPPAALSASASEGARARGGALALPLAGRPRGVVGDRRAPGGRRRWS